MAWVKGGGNKDLAQCSQSCLTEKENSLNFIGSSTNRAFQDNKCLVFLPMLRTH